MLTTLITIIHVFTCCFLILVVLLQAGKGGGMGMAFGSAASQQVFGGRGAGGLLEKVTAGTAIVFMLTSITLAHSASKTENSRLQEISDKKKKDTEERKKKEAEENKKAEEAAKKELESKGAAPATTPAPTPGAEKPAPGAEKPATETAPATPKSDEGKPAKEGEKPSE
jgi:preprotein translocase subunit SecG